MAKRGTLEHPKTIELAEVLGIMECFALGIMEAFWHHVAKYHEDGDVTGLKPGVLCRSIRYTGDANQLWNALVQVGVVDCGEDGRAIVHGWSEHAEDNIHSRLYRAVRTFADGEIPKPNKLGKEEREALKKQWEARKQHPEVPQKARKTPEKAPEIEPTGSRRGPAGVPPGSQRGPAGVPAKPSLAKPNQDIDLPLPPQTGKQVQAGMKGKPTSLDGPEVPERRNKLLHVLQAEDPEPDETHEEREALARKRQEQIALVLASDALPDDSHGVPQEVPSSA